MWSLVRCLVCALYTLTGAPVKTLMKLSGHIHEGGKRSGWGKLGRRRLVRVRGTREGEGYVNMITICYVHV